MLGVEARVAARGHCRGLELRASPRQLRVIDEQIVLDGSFNWYNTSTLSHDLMVVLNHRDVARLYL